MAITQAFPTARKTDALAAICASGDTVKIALYTSSASLDATATSYSTTNEVVGTGYTAGGATLSGYSAGTSGTTAYITWSNPSWAAATITARGAVIYNATQSNKILAVIDFGADKTSTNGTFTVQLPAAGASAILTIA